MAIKHTLTVTLNDDNGMTAEQASQLGNAMTEYLIKNFKGDNRISTMPVTFASEATTITAT